MLDFMRRQRINPEVGMGDPHFHIQRDPGDALHPVWRPAERQHHE